MSLRPSRFWPLSSTSDSAHQIWLYLLYVMLSWVKKCQSKSQSRIHCLKNVIFRIEVLGLKHARNVSYGDIASLATVNLTETFIPVWHRNYWRLSTVLNLIKCTVLPTLLLNSENVHK